MLPVPPTRPAALKLITIAGLIAKSTLLAEWQISAICVATLVAILLGLSFGEVKTTRLNAF